MTAILAIDIGGTKFSLAAFQGDEMISSPLEPTRGGPDWMVPRIIEIASGWQRGISFVRCGVGFGGPVDFATQRVLFSTHVAGWVDYPLVPTLQASLAFRPSWTTTPTSARWARAITARASV
ncbi:MAG: ROK family protein [Caldilineales bacterium]